MQAHLELPGFQKLKGQTVLNFARVFIKSESAVIVKVAIKVMPEVIKAFRSRIRKVCGSPSVGTKRKLIVFNVAFTEVSGCGSSLFSVYFGVKGRCESDEVITYVTHQYPRFCVSVFLDRIGSMNK